MSGSSRAADLTGGDGLSPRYDGLLWKWLALSEARPTAARRLQPAQRTIRTCSCNWEQAMPSVLITGANRGLGFEFARQYAAEGWLVFATCRQPRSAAALQGLTTTGMVKIISLDVTDETTIKEASRQIEEPIDLLINSAGISGPPDQRTGKVDYGAWREVLDVNTMGPLRVTDSTSSRPKRTQAGGDHHQRHGIDW